MLFLHKGAMVMDEVEEENVKATVSFNLADQFFSATGSEAFVERTMKEALATLKAVAQNGAALNEKPGDTSLESSVGDLPDEPEMTEVEGLDKYIQAGIFSYNSEEERYEISKLVPGETKAQRMTNIGLLLCYVNGGAVTSDDIKEQALRQGTFDKKQMTQRFAKDTRQFVKAKGAVDDDWSVSLTVQGKRNVQVLLDQLLTAAI